MIFLILDISTPHYKVVVVVVEVTYRTNCQRTNILILVTNRTQRSLQGLPDISLVLIVNNERHEHQHIEETLSDVFPLIEGGLDD